MNAMATVGDVYGSGMGMTWDNAFAVGGDTLSSDTVAAGIASAPTPALNSVNVAPGLRINPLVGAIVVLAFLFGIKLLHEWKRAESDFAEVKIGVMSIVTVTLMAAAGLPLLKAILAKYRIPGVSAYVLNA